MVSVAINDLHVSQDGSSNTTGVIERNHAASDLHESRMMDKSANKPAVETGKGSARP
jgi:hypothetical protein